MEIYFSKYHGTGNDFVLINQMEGVFYELNTEQIAGLCHRRFGIGADGLMFLRPAFGYDFEMVYYNSDGNPSSMCGNGGRCIVKFAHDLGYIGDTCRFIAIDGEHSASVDGDQISLGMIDVESISKPDNNTFVLNTGSPHFVHFSDLSYLPAILDYGKKIRYSEQYKESGINVNLVSIQDDHIAMATYERGVEDETYSCGTGVVAAALAAAEVSGRIENTKVKTKGGDLSVSFQKTNSTYHNIILHGPAILVFAGKTEVQL